MKIAYIANVGTRDIKLDGECLASPRREGEEILADYSTMYPRLTAPILKPGLDHVLSRAQRVDVVLLFATDQARQSEKRYRDKDTIELGKILELFLPEAQGTAIGRVECRPISHNPADYEKSVRFYAEHLPDLIPPGEFDAIWVAPIGGADASNVGLTLNATRIYRNKCQFIYVFPEGKVQTLSLHSEILDSFAREEAAAHLARHDFLALRETLSRSRRGTPWHLALCAYADSRLRFDFDGARKAFDCVPMSGAEERLHLEQCLDSLEPLLNEPGNIQPTSESDEAAWAGWLDFQRSCLSELYINLKLKADRGEWVDFLGRLFRLSEACLRFVFEETTRHSTEKTSDGYPDFVKAIKSDPEVIRFLQEKQIPLSEPDSHVLRMWLAYQARSNATRFGPIHGVMKKIEKLSVVRNKSILAHGYQGISRERLEELVNGTMEQFIHDDLGRLLRCLGARVSDDSNPFLLIVRRLEEVL